MWIKSEYFGKENMRRFSSVCFMFAGLLAITAGGASAATVYNLTYVGDGNAASGTATITLDTSAISVPGFTEQDLSPFVTDFSLTITNATNPDDNGTFDFGAFNGSGTLGGFLMNISAGSVDFNADLIGQIDDFNI